MQYPPVALSITAAELCRSSIAVVGMGGDGKRTLVVAEFGERERERIHLRIGDTAVRTPMPRVVSIRVHPESSLAELVLAHAHVKAISAGSWSYLRWMPEIPSDADDHFYWPDVLKEAAVVVGIVLSSILLADPFFFWFWMTPMAVYLAIKYGGPAFVRKFKPPSSHPWVTDERGEIRASVFMARVPEAAIATPIGPTPAERVGLVKAEYGRLLTDICYRIENSAMFDAAVPQTSRFEVALLAWDSTGRDVGALATEIEASFGEARRHAEQIGLGHLPETARDPARRAMSAASVALGSGTDGERSAARGRVAEILSSLALYYLPPIDPDVPELIGVRRAIEPAP